VAISGYNARRVVFGALNLRTGARLFAARGKNRAADFQAFLKQIRAAYRGRPVALLLDEHSAHTAKDSVRAAAGLTLLWLPSRSPELNPLDTLWGRPRTWSARTSSTPGSRTRPTGSSATCAGCPTAGPWRRRVSCPTPSGSATCCQRTFAYLLSGLSLPVRPREGAWAGQMPQG
jgi:hypothetical protein